MNSRMRFLLRLASVLLGVGLFSAAFGADPPSYQLRYLGPGSPSGISNGDANSVVVIGARTNSAGYYEPLVSIGGKPWSVLPKPNEAMSVFPTDVNDSGVIVGVSYDTSWNAVSVRWKPVNGSYAVDVLPRLGKDPSSYATGINNLGQIVGARRALGYVPAATTGWLYSATGGLSDLTAYGFWVVPNAVNDQTQIIGGVERLDLTAGSPARLTVIGSPGPSGYGSASGVAINNSAMVAGNAVMSSISLNIVSVFRYSNPTDYDFVAGTTRYTGATSINNLGDIGYGEQGAGVDFLDLGRYAVNDLLASNVTRDGWYITGNGAHINDGRLIATFARNWYTSAAGGVLLVAASAPPPDPTPPSLIVNRIDLSYRVNKGNKASVTGNVYVVDGKGAAVSGASVSVTWTLPTGSTRAASATTGTNGTAGFSVSGGLGTYTLRVSGVSKADYTFDSGKSVLSKSITVVR